MFPSQNIHDSFSKASASSWISSSSFSASAAEISGAILKASSIPKKSLGGEYCFSVFEIYNSSKKEIARGGRYDGLLKSLGSKKNISAVGAAINLNNLKTWKI